MEVVDGARGAAVLRVVQYLGALRKPSARHREEGKAAALADFRMIVRDFWAPQGAYRLCVSRPTAPAIYRLASCASEAWRCALCDERPGRGFVCAAEALPHLLSTAHDANVLHADLDEPNEVLLPSREVVVTGTVLETARRDDHSVQSQCRSRLRVVFTASMRIAAREYCVVDRVSLCEAEAVARDAAVVSQALADIAPGAPEEEVRAAVGGARAKLAALQGRVEESHRKHDADLKRYIQTLQITDVMHVLEDIMDHCGRGNGGPLNAMRVLAERRRGAEVAAACRRQELPHSAEQPRHHVLRGQRCAARLRRGRPPLAALRKPGL